MIAARRTDAVDLDREMSAVAASVSHAVRSGTGLAPALGDAARVVHPTSALADDLHRIEVAVERGRPLDAELDRWSRTRPEASVALFVAACRFGHARGGDLAAALDGAAVSLLDRVEVADEARALAAQARSSAAVLVALPLVGAAGFSLLDPAVARVLLTTRPGWICLGVGLLLDAVGAWVLSGLVRRALR